MLNHTNRNCPQETQKEEIEKPQKKHIHHIRMSLLCLIKEHHKSKQQQKTQPKKPAPVGGGKARHGN